MTLNITQARTHARKHMNTKEEKQRYLMLIRLLIIRFCVMKSSERKFMQRNRKLEHKKCICLPTLLPQAFLYIKNTIALIYTRSN